MIPECKVIQEIIIKKKKRACKILPCCSTPWNYPQGNLVEPSSCTATLCPSPSDGIQCSPDASPQTPSNLELSFHRLGTSSPLHQTISSLFFFFLNSKRLRLALQIYGSSLKTDFTNIKIYRLV